MCALKAPESSSRRKELRSNAIVDLYARSIIFFEENKKTLYAAGAGLVVLIAAVGLYLWNAQQTETEAQEHLGQIERAYAAGNYEQALQGTESQMGLLEIADTYSSTNAGNLATFYIANAYLRNDMPEEALTYLRRFDKDRDLVGASALAAEASILEDRESYGEAADLYEQAASYAESASLSPRYLLNAGRAHESAGNWGDAERAYTRIQENYPDAPETADVERHLARVDAKRTQAAS